MGTFHPRSRRFTPPPGAVMLLALLACSPAAHGQNGTYRIDAGARVSTIAFTFTGTESFTPAQLGAAIRTTALGPNVGLRNTFSFLPLVTPVGDHPFSPVQLQEDVARLRQFYRGSGFSKVRVDYTLTYDREANLVDVTFVIDEGPPGLLRSVQVAGPDGSPLVLPADIAVEWEALLREAAPRTGRRMDHDTPGRFASTIVAWLRDNGYPAATASAAAVADTVLGATDLVVRVDPGERMRIAGFRPAGQELVDSSVILREIPVAPGDWYSASALQEGRQELMGLGIFRQVRFMPDSAGAAPGELPLRIEFSEGDVRTLTGDLGYDSRGGITTTGQWQHRNFPGDARRLTVSVLAQTGLLSFQSIPEIVYRGSVALEQPYVFNRKTSLVLEPYVEYRDDQRDRSNAVGLSASLIWRASPLATVALRYAISGRRVDEYRYGDYSSGKADLLTIIAQTSLGGYVKSSTVSLLPVYGVLDDLVNPTKGFGLRPDFRITFPGSLNSIEYGRVDLVVTGYLPITGAVGLKARVSAGRLFPMGDAPAPDGSDSLARYLQFRDVAFTAGGSEDVRGWESRLLGPKVPDARVDFANGDTTFYADNYIPVGGLARVSFSLEVRLPFPGLGKTWGTMVFLDGGRVWNPQGGVYASAEGYEADRMFFATGAGVDVRTPVGAIRTSVGYKLNPSPLDLRPAPDVFQAIQSGAPVESVPAKESLRWQFNLSLGVAF